MRIVFVLCALHCLLLNGQQDLGRRYFPLQSQGRLPAVFTQDIRNVVKQDLTDLNRSKDKDTYLKSSFLTASNYQIDKIIRSGNTLVNDEVTVYLNELADIILKDNPSLRRQIQIFTLKSHVVNAYSFDKGYIFVDIGLIAQVESEAQLAYILCHEISHFTRQHHINTYVTNAYIDGGRYDGSSKEERLIEKCQYSKENESEADLDGFKLFERTRYDLEQAGKGFDVLQYAHLPFELVEFKKEYFETPHYKIPERYFLKDVSAIRDNSDEDDTRMTHPNTKRRKQAIAELIAQRDNSGRVKSQLGAERFEYIRDVARMELCRLYLKKRDYPNALYAAYILSLKYPENEYLAEIRSKSLYGLTLNSRGDIHYNSDSQLENGLPGYKEIESYPQQLYHLAEKMPTNEFTILALNHVFRAHQKFPRNKAIGTISDSLFSLMQRTSWGIASFAQTIKTAQDTVAAPDTVAKKAPSSKTELIASLQKEQMRRGDDTVYYRNAFIDLFKDEEFKRKMPVHGIYGQEDFGSTNVFTLNGRNSDVRVSPTRAKTADKKKSSLNKVLILDPFYVKVDETERQEIQYLLSDERQELFVQSLGECASRLSLPIQILDPGTVDSSQADLLNDFAVMNDWFDEKFDSDQSGVLILNTSDINNVLEKYGTRFVLKTGVASVTNISGRKRTYFYGFLYDLRSNDLVYRRYEYFSGKDRRDFLNAKTYQMLYEITRSLGSE